MRTPIVFTCAICEATLDTGTSSEEKAGQTAAKELWMVGLPWGKVWCARCTKAYTYVGYRHQDVNAGTV